MALVANSHNSTSEESARQCDQPIDWVHLARYTLGNKAVEKEVLELFSRQSSQYLERLRTAKDPQAWREAAHTIKGSARGVGAWRVAAKAEALEKLGEQAFEAAREAALDGLELNIREVIACIEDMLGAS